LIAPHIDPNRGGRAYAWAYKQVAEQSDADLFVILGTAHNPLAEQFCVARKDFWTPLGTVPTDRRFVDRMTAHLASSVAGRRLDLSADEAAHRFEHSIEFQAVLLQYVLGGRRDFRIVPVLIASFQDFIDAGSPPDESLDVQSFLSAVLAAAGEHRGAVCYIAAADLAHVGQRFGDPWTLDARRLAEQSADDRTLLELACRRDSAGFFEHAARQRDSRRICGLSPIYVLLSLVQGAKGELLCYDQATEPDGSSCVSFASVAFWRG
jgi:MEMO1 family protein